MGPNVRKTLLGGAQQGKFLQKKPRSQMKDAKRKPKGAAPPVKKSEGKKK